MNNYAYRSDRNVTLRLRKKGGLHYTQVFGCWQLAQSPQLPLKPWVDRLDYYSNSYTLAGASRSTLKSYLRRVSAWYKGVHASSLQFMMKHFTQSYNGTSFLEKRMMNTGR